jgi:hypothetical protein
MNDDLPMVVFSLTFRDSIELVDPRTDAPIASGPHWLRGGGSQMAAYVRGSAVAIEAVFLNINGLDANQKVASVRASGGAGGVGSLPVALDFNPAGLSAPTRFELAGALPDAIGAHSYELHWYAGLESGRELYIGSTSHTILTTWQPPIGSDPEHTWCYAPVMAWSCAWAAGRVGPKAICDALIESLPLSGLRYGIADIYGLRGLLLRGGGMCGAWYRLFQHLAWCQGVAVERRDLTVVTDQPVRRGANRLWDGVATGAGGVNQLQPAVDPVEFAEATLAFPRGPEPVPVEHVTARRYAFRGAARAVIGLASSTHAVNFVQDSDGQVYLYDPSFGAGPFPFAGPIPEDGAFMHGEELAAFKQGYFDATFPFLIGSIRNGEDDYQTLWRPSPQPAQYGLLVASSLVSPDDLTIGWSVNGGHIV